MIDLFADQIAADPVRPVQPRALDHHEWPPNYTGIFAWRMRQLAAMRKDPSLVVGAKAYYSTRPAEWIQHWVDTFDPRRTDNKWIPFTFFKRQEELVRFLHECRNGSENGLIEKCRDAGATWVCCAYSVWSWLFIPNDAIGWGSRKSDLVDKLGDADSIFEKMRLIINRIPPEFLPDGFNPRLHATYMKMINPETGATISGEAGDNIGRGGRSSMYFKDEAQPLSSKILTPSGWTLMGGVRVGQHVSHPDGGYSTVTHINEVGECKTYRITFVDGTTAECSENHLWQLVSSVTGKTSVKRLSDILDNYVYNSPGGQTQYRWSVPHAKPIEFDKHGDELPLHPYVVGALLGDGGIKQVPKYRPRFTCVDEEIISEMRRLLPETCTMSGPHDGKEWNINDIDGRRGKGKLSRASLAIMSAGIAGHGAETKFVPYRYKFASVDERLALLQGLMDTDGSASGGTDTFHTCSRRLADDVRFIVQSLGGSASLAVKPDHRGYRDMFCLHIVFNNGIVPFRLSRKINQRKPRKQVWGRKIVKIEDIGIQPVRCITVDRQDGLYLTDNCVVTHNCAHYERPEKIEAALGDNTNVQIDISSVNGIGNVFHRRREQGVDWFPDADLPPNRTRVFVFDWSDHPAKTQQWYDDRKEKAEREGMQHVFAQEVDRNYSAAVSNTIIAQEWIVAAVDAHIKIPYLAAEPPINKWMAGLDVADEGNDRNALALRQWIIVRSVEEWGERDPGVSTRRAIAACREHRPLKVQYDCVGVGAAVKAEYNRLVDEGNIDKRQIEFIPWNAGAKVINGYDRIIPDDELSPTNREMFYNFKAQAWWSLRTKFYKTFRAIKDGIVYPADELISLDSTMPLLQQLIKELAQPTRADSSTLQMVVQKKPSGTKSPNLADAVVQCMFPAPDDAGTVEIGRYQ